MCADVPVLGGEVKKGEQRFLGQTNDRLVVLGIVFVGDRSIAASAAARVGAPQISRRSIFMLIWTERATLLSTLAVL